MIRRCLAAVAALAALAPATPPVAQDADDAGARAAVEGFMAAFDAKDGEAMAAYLTEDAYLAWVREGEDSGSARSVPLQDLVDSISAIPGDIAEPLAIRSVMAEGPVAMVWADYGVYLDGERSHCGVDVFTLLRVDGDWKIATVTYSHLTQGCEDAPTP